MVQAVVQLHACQQRLSHAARDVYMHGCDSRCWHGVLVLQAVEQLHALVMVIAALVALNAGFGLCLEVVVRLVCMGGDGFPTESCVET